MQNWKRICFLIHRIIRFLSAWFKMQIRPADNLSLMLLYKSWKLEKLDVLLCKIGQEIVYKGLLNIFNILMYTIDYIVGSSLVIFGYISGFQNLSILIVRSILTWCSLNF